MRSCLLLWVLLVLVGCKAETPAYALHDTPERVQQSNNEALQQAFAKKQSNIFLEGEGIVKKLLPDDNKGARHQKFLVSISDQQTLLFAHNIDLAPRIEDIQVGDVVTFRGEYVYNPKGGVMHWTHHDPQGHKAGGWIKHNGKTYQ